MDLDLGQKVVVNVKIDGGSHELRLPTVYEAQTFQEKMKSAEGKEIDVFCELVTSLGLPEAAARGLDINQFQKLSEGLLGLTEKK